MGIVSDSWRGDVPPPPRTVIGAAVTKLSKVNVLRNLNFKFLHYFHSKKNRYNVLIIPPPKGFSLKRNPKTRQPVRLQHVLRTARLIAARTVIWQLFRALMWSLRVIDVICSGICFSSVSSINSTVQGPNSLVQKSLLGVAIVTSEGGGNRFVTKSALFWISALDWALRFNVYPWSTSFPFLLEQVEGTCRFERSTKTQTLVKTRRDNSWKRRQLREAVLRQPNLHFFGHLDC